LGYDRRAASAPQTARDREGAHTDDQGPLLDQLPAAHVTTQRRVATFPDLGAVVYLDEVPTELLGELPGLYSSAYSVAEYFIIYDRPRRMYACELDEPRHIIVFTSHGATADVLNKVIDIEPEAVERVAAAIFRARPEIRRIRAEVKFPPRELGLPLRQLYHADDQVVELPETPWAWESSLGTSTRKHLHRYRNQLRRKYPDFNLCTMEGAEITLPLVEQVFDWNQQRVHAKGEKWIYESQFGVSYKAWRLMQSHGVALCGHVGDECVAAHLRLFVGDQCWAHTGGFDPVYTDVHLGTLMTSFSICDSITRGCARFHLGWGTIAYKLHLGAAPVTAYRISIYRSRLNRALYARERWSLIVRDRNDIYWRTRGAIKRRLLGRLSTGRG
jgi:hypothetical protein